MNAKNVTLKNATMTPDNAVTHKTVASNDVVTTYRAETVSSRYVRLWCPICGAKSPVCDQEADVARQGLHDWWQPHLAKHATPLFEVVTP